MKQGIISPQDWGLQVFSGSEDLHLPALEISAGDIERRLRANLFQWLPRQIDPSTGAFFGFYRAKDGYREPPQTVNLIASWQLLAAYDRYMDEQLLERACQALEFYYDRFVVSHPMSVVAGGARDGVASHQIWTKFSAEFAIGAWGLYQRTGLELWKERALQSGRYLLQAARHAFSPGYDLKSSRWHGRQQGWDSWGRAVEACLLLSEAEPTFGSLARRWGEHALEIQAPDGCYYLIDGEYYNTDLAADELRALLFLYELDGDLRYFQAARRFASWHFERQRPDGAWPMTIDRDGNVAVPTVGPGDMPNIAISLLRLHDLTGEEVALSSALRAFRYSLSRQVLPASDQPFSDDPSAQWGFWSWDPHYDYSLSADQATHHVRGMMFLLDYLAAKGLI